jgi:hypothetical protein
LWEGCGLEIGGPVSHVPPDAPNTTKLCVGTETGRRNNWLKMSMPGYDMSQRTNESVHSAVILLSRWQMGMEEGDKAIV